MERRRPGINSRQHSGSARSLASAGSRRLISPLRGAHPAATPAEDALRHTARHTPGEQRYNFFFEIVVKIKDRR